MKIKSLLIVVSCLFSASLMAADADLSRQLVGLWEFSATNTAMNGVTQTRNTQTHYRTNGVFTIEGTIGMACPTNANMKVLIKREDGSFVPREQSFTRPISGSGTWRVEQGYLYRTITNSSSMVANTETKYQIISLTAQNLTYRNKQDRIRTESRK